MDVGAVDLTILAMYLLAVLAFGFWIGAKRRTASDYQVGGRDLPSWAVLGSIVATETSTVTFLSLPGVAYFGDLRFLQIPMGYVIGRFLVAAILLPGYFRGQIVTAYEILQHRFGAVTRRLATGLFLLTRSLADGLRLALSALVLQQMTGWAFASCVLVLGLVTIVYTTLGGMRAVIWTDVIQLFVYLLGAIAAFWVLLSQLSGGLGAVFDIASAEGKLRVFDFGWDLTNPMAFWAGLVGGAFMAFATHGVDQLLVQRYLCARNERAARRALQASGFVVLGQFALFLLLGSALYAYYLQFPPAVAFSSTAKDAVFATFIVSELPVGVLGLVLGAVFAAAMSTLSSSLNSSATAAVHDWVVPLRGNDASDAQVLRWTRLGTLVFGAIQIAIGIIGAQLTTSVIGSVLAIASFVTGIVLGVYFLGLWAPAAQQKDALLGLCVGLTTLSLLYAFTELAWPWYAFVGSTLTFGSGWVSSKLRVGVVSPPEGALVEP
ncbi:MAG: sodium:solute symporter [Planctomycetota bacterium]